MLFGNAIHLDRALYTSEGVSNDINQPKNYRMLSVQSTLINVAQKLQRKHRVTHLKNGEGKEITEFSNSYYVLVKYPHTAFGNKPPTKLHSMWRGPLRVINHIGPVYTLQEMASMKLEDVHVKLLKTYVHDEQSNEDAIEVAMADKQQIFVEQVSNHRGDIKLKSSLEFLVKWQNFEAEHNTWEPWSSLRQNALKSLHAYLKKHKKLKHYSKFYSRCNPEKPLSEVHEEPRRS